MIPRFLLRSRPFQNEVRKQVRAALASAETDNTFFVGSRAFGDLYRDRFDYDRKTIFDESLRAWRVNPIARRLVAITTEYVIGAEGFKRTCSHRRTDKFLTEFWDHPLNNLDEQIGEWCSELTRAGNLFLLVSTDISGMPLVRAVAPENIKEIDTAPNDYRQELSYQAADLEPVWLAYDRNNPQPVFMLHYVINRPVGAVWGESDLAPLLPWLGRFASWLEDRARLNRFRLAFIWVVKKKWTSEVEKLKRQSELNANPPAPGTVYVADPDETWEAPSPKLESPDANLDGLSLKKMIAAGIGIPLHYLAEPESSTRTTAEAAGMPTFKCFEQRQRLFLNIIKQVLKVAVRVRKDYDPLIKIDAIITVEGPDVSEKDNAALALATGQIVAAFSKLYDLELITADELMRITYRFAGEVWPPKTLAPSAGIVKPKSESVVDPSPGGIHVDTDTGEVTTDE